MQALIAESFNQPAPSMTQFTIGRDENMKDVSHLEEEKKQEHPTKIEPQWKKLIENLGMTEEEYEKDKAIRCPICFDM